MTARDELEAASRTSWGTDVDAAMRRHPAGSGAHSKPEMVLTTRELVELNRLLTVKADRPPALPPNWQVRAAQEPELSARHKLAVEVLLGVTALLVLLVVGRIVWQGISTVVGL